MYIVVDDELMHYGMPRRSGRYPWGSGEHPYQDRREFMSYVTQMRNQGMSDTEIAKSRGMTTSQFRARVSLAKSENRQSDIQEAIRLKDKGYSDKAIAERLSLSESTVRNYLKPGADLKREIAFSTADELKSELEKNPYLDIGLGAEARLGISRTRLKTAIELLKEQGYKTEEIYTEQLGTGKQTTVLVLCKDDVPVKELYANRDKIIAPGGAYSTDGGETYTKIQPPVSIDGSRIKIIYAEDGGLEKDGLIEVREGVNDLTMGSSRYAQVRIGVDGTHYMKGMAVYGDGVNFPEGVDVLYYTNKKRGTAPQDVYKKMSEDDANNPFGATIRQIHYTDASGQEHLSPMNLVNREGDWYEWSRTISSQVLSKQSPQLAEKQLGLAFDIRADELSEIQSLTNPSIKRFFLDKYADSCDADAVHLKAAAMPRQSTNVILPIPTLADNEVYAPMYRDGERVALIRYPHGGIFEIADVTVNNRNTEARKVIGNGKDAVGINSKVAAQLSGADFDGDTVIVIPNSRGQLSSASYPESLKNFDPKSYKLPDDAPRISERTKNIKMGDVSNLITDMTIRGAPQADIVRAVKHSMVVIDSYKHHLDYKQSYIDNGIAELKAKYQGSARSGASTLISKAKAKSQEAERKEGVYVTDPTTGKTRRLYVDPETGEKLYRTTGATRGVYKKNSKGEVVVDEEGKPIIKRIAKTTGVPRMSLTTDAYTLSSGTPMENVYASHANKLKDLARTARKEALETKSTPYSPKAAQVYSAEVQSLNEKLRKVVLNKPAERQAQLIANAIVAAQVRDNPDIQGDRLKKVRNQALQEGRARSGASKTDIKITPAEWKAIQAGAISPTKLDAILQASDMDVLRSYALPREYNGLAPAKERRAKEMLARGYTQSQVADALGVSVTTIMNAINPKAEQ